MVYVPRNSLASVWYGGFSVDCSSGSVVFAAGRGMARAERENESRAVACVGFWRCALPGST